ncbi:hypothetical protein BDW71DRAFT_213665 [Aspergillus fruticulosus]
MNLIFYRAYFLTHPSEFLEAFFVGARSLIERDAESMQEVIRYMSEEHGLRYIQQLVEREFAALPSATRRDVFRAQVIPFLETISHPRVLSSLVAEHALGAIYNFIYGIGGTRAARFISSICSVLETLSEDDDTRAQWLEDSLAVFYRIMFVNSTAFIQVGLEEQALKLQEILTAMDKGDMSRKLHVSRRNLNRLLSRIETGAQMRTAQTAVASQTRVIKFVPSQDLPGGRHDNDYKDFSLIQIMPTMEEILSSRPEHLPERDPASWHVSGLEGLLDRNFRLLREDTVGLIRDSIHHIIKRLPGNRPRANLYRGARIVETRIYWGSGFEFQVSFPRPPHLGGMSAPQRKTWWSMSKRLQPGALVCITINGDHAIFCKVVYGPDEQGHDREKASRQSKKTTKATCSQKDAGGIFIMLTTVGPDERAVRSILDHYDRPAQFFMIIELPGVLLASFEPTLRALQRIKMTSQLPFENLLVPSGTDQQIMIPPPLYSLRNGFQFNLRCLMTDETDFFVHPDVRVDPERLYTSSILDPAQARALVNSLQHCIGLIQGPPGTGKSYTGIALVKVLLANKLENGANIGPILCVSYTNHALDQLLESLLDQNITMNIVRIGSQSKSERLRGCNLRAFAKLATRTREEKSIQKHLRFELLACENKFNRLSFRDIPAAKIPPYLYQHYPHYFEQLFYKDEYNLKPSQVKRPGAIVEAWLTSGPVVTSNVSRCFEDLLRANIHSMTRSERELITRCEAMELVSVHAGVKRDWDRIRSEVDLRCLNEADVIEMLQKLQAKVVICEEAGEVLEAHLLTALLPSVEHAILIGDHLQLRPQLQNYDLSRENPNGGDRYSLDLSLFERLPYSTLETQRRMHPSIARLVRDTLYPDLKDAACVSQYPEVSGMKKRLFWLDHRYYEEGAPDDAVTTSHWNEHEVEITVALVSHLISQGDYKIGDIAVLTPYLGQLHRLRQKLSQLFTICISEGDQEELERAGLEIEDCPSPIKSNLLDALRVATIDNFQGEEAKIVVISLVRSNPQNRCGFLSTPNRINVLLSRAQYGMYIVGNSETSAHVPMWAQVIQILREDDNIGLNIHLECPRHPDALLMVSEPSDFLQLSPEGGCSLRCTKRLKCGHACEQQCHSDMLHNSVLCGQPCAKLRKGCTHPCPEICGNPCPFNCMVPVTRKGRSLVCGHVKETLPCFQDQDLTKFLCEEIVTKVVPHCNHKVSEPCHLDISAVSYKCMSLCDASLSCGHTCNSRCYECRTLDGINHGKCHQKCARSYSTCRHACKSACHSTEPCPPCDAVCEVRCNHSKCTRKCSEPCTPCAEENCLSACPHSTCTMPCAAPCNHVPCSRRCERTLQCGHKCPAVCGEQCPPVEYCQICAEKAIKTRHVDFILDLIYKDVNLDNNPCIFPSCGHFLTMESMDAQMDLGKYYMLDDNNKPISIREDLKEPFQMEDIKNCALCRGHLRDVARYGRLVRQALLDESTKKFILCLNREYLPLAEEMARKAQSLQDHGYKSKVSLSTVIRINGDRSHQIQAMRGALGDLSVSRWEEILRLDDQIELYRRRVSPSEQPLIRILALVESARRRQNAPSSGNFDCGSTALQLKGTLLATALSLRLHIALLTDFLRIKGRARARLTIDLGKSRKECEHFIDTAQESRFSHLEAEGHLFFAQLHALERCHCVDTTASRSHLEKGLASLERARSIIATLPAQTRGLESEINSTEKMLLSTFYSIVTNAERLAVVQAMASEFAGTGHWYYCQNGHPFTIGECGAAMQESLCPECGAPVGGRQHQVVDGVTSADDLEKSGGVSL